MTARWEVRYDRETSLWIARSIGSLNHTSFKRWRNAWDYARWAVRA